MASFIPFEIETDHAELAELAYERLQELVPGWQPSPANFESLLIDALALIAAEERDVAADVPAAIFRGYGAKLVGLPPVDAEPATGQTTWTMIDSAGHTIPAGTLVGMRTGGGELIAFQVEHDILVPAGSSVTDTGDVTIVAVELGSEGTGLTGPVELIDTMDFVDSVVLEDPTTGGVDAEDDDTYLNRLATELQLFTRRPILPGDFEILARRHSSVQRALAIDLYDPNLDTYDNERTVTVAVMAEDGQPLSTSDRDEVDAQLQAEREVNFVVHVIDPTYTTVDVTFTAVAYEGYDPAAVQTDAIVAVTSYLDPANWGLPPLGDEEVWLQQTKVRYLEVAEVLNRVTGLHYIESLTINEDGGVAGTSDIDLAGPAPLPTAGVISGTVSEP